MFTVPLPVLQETDYIMSYFDNGEDFGGDSDDNMDEAIYWNAMCLLRRRTVQQVLNMKSWIWFYPFLMCESWTPEHSGGAILTSSDELQQLFLRFSTKVSCVFYVFVVETVLSVAEQRAADDGR